MLIESSASAGLGYYVWWFPGSPVRVHLSLDVVHRLREQLQLAGPKAAEEGLLYGKPIEGATEVLDFQPAAGRVPQVVATLGEGSAKRRLVGYYRIETGDTLRLNQNDLSLARSSFAQPYHVFLVIQPTGFGPPNAGFFFHDSDGKMAEFSLMEFPFDPSLLAGEERDRLKRSQEAAARRAAALQPASPAPAPARSLTASRRRIALAAMAPFALLIFAVGVWAAGRPLQAWWSRWRVAGAEPAAALRPVPALSALSMGLRARRENGDVEITWNRESPVIAGATSGVLSLQDGSSKREIALDTSQVRNGSVLYTPVGGQVSVQLAVTTPVSTVIEHVVLLVPGNASPRQLAAPLAATIPNPAPERALKPFTPPSSSVAPSVGEMPPLPLPAVLPPVHAAIPDSVLTMIAQPAMPSAPARLPDPPPNGAAPASPVPAYQPAEPIRRVVPSVPIQFLATMAKPATLEVRVAIDATGRVTRAEAVPHRGVNNLALNVLVTAARLWTFKPARRGDQPVASDYVLQFHFSK